jgi:hypothetical protein
MTRVDKSPDQLAIDPARIHWRIIASTRSAEHARVAPYIDARDVMEKLDEHFPGWSDTYRAISVGNDHGLECSLTVPWDGDGTRTVTDVGVVRAGRADSPEMAPVKAAYSDALKRTAVKLGIGRELYNLPEFYCPADYVANGKVKSVKALPRWDAAAGRWLPAVGGWIRTEESAQLVEGDLPAERAEAEAEPPPRAVDQRDRRATRIERIRALVAEAEALDSRTVNAHSIRNHIRKQGWDGIGTLPQLYARGDIEQLNDIGRYIAGKIAEAGEDNQDPPPARAEDMTDEEAIAAGAALLGNGGGY